VLPPDAVEWGRKQGIPAPPDLNCRGQAAQLPITNFQLSERSGDPASLAGPIVVTSPAPNSVFSVTSRIPAEMQRIEVSARLNGTGASGDVTLLVDGQAIGTFARAPYRALWPLAPGEHAAQAVGVDANGQRVESNVIQFQVQAGE
jgi:hypothetical protein